MKVLEKSKEDIEDEEEEGQQEEENRVYHASLCPEAEPQGDDYPWLWDLGIKDFYAMLIIIIYQT